MNDHKLTAKVEFGDFQTPPVLAQQVCRRLIRTGLVPRSIVEPTCGQGSMLLAAMNEFPQVTHALGVEINASHLDYLQERIYTRQDATKIQMVHQDFFQTSWSTMLNKFPDPLLVIGNPPWVTNAGLATLESSNLPQKSNFQGFAGLDAITGKSNFDISEWMLIHLLEQLGGHAATLAMLCKTAVARRVLTFAWQKGIAMSDATICLIDAKLHFNAAVDACLLICEFKPGRSSLDAVTQQCDIYEDLSTQTPLSTFGYWEGKLIADLSSYERWQHLFGESPYQWRSGIKHDCAKVMELTQENDDLYRNGLGETVTLESSCLYGLLKSSDIAKTTTTIPRRYMIVPQTTVGEQTQNLRLTAPQTWAYLTKYGEWFDRRKSAIYKKQPKFAIFGVGPYSFSPWKVAISGLYKSLNFAIVGPYHDKPVVFDDTCYFIPCNTKAEATLLANMLNSEIAQQFFRSFIFWDNKRPITSALLNQLDLKLLAQEMNCMAEFSRLCMPQSSTSTPELQLSLFP